MQVLGFSQGKATTYCRGLVITATGVTGVFGIRTRENDNGKLHITNNNTNHKINTVVY
jgi:hypothetical protein